MSTLSQQDFDKYAAAIASDYVAKKIPLKDSVTKVASECDLNPEQLARLCEASNNATFAALFAEKGKQGSDDRMVDFDVVHAKDLLGGELQAAKTAMAKTASFQFDALHEMRPLDESAMKVASEVEHFEGIVDEGRAARDVARDKRALRKVAEELRYKKASLELIYLDAVSAASSRFRKLYGPNHETFEKEAVEAYGEDAYPVLAHIRQALRKELVIYTPEKLASYPNTSTREHNLFQAALAEAKKLADVTTTLSRLPE